PEGAGPRAPAGADQARDVGHDRGVAPVRRVPPRGGEQPGDPLRARHPDVRERHPQHAGHLRDPGGEEAQPPADPRRPQPRHGPAGQGAPHGPGRDRGRGRRPAHRGPRQPREGAVRRRAEPLPATVRDADGRAARDRAGRGPQPAHGPHPRRGAEVATEPAAAGDAIVVRNLTKVFRGRPAVDHISFRVARGRFFGFLGPNGAGKSTTIKMLTGLLRPTEGEATIEGHPLEQELLAVKRVIGVLPEELPLYERLTGEEYLHFAGRMYGLSRE